MPAMDDENGKYLDGYSLRHTAIKHLRASNSDFWTIRRLACILRLKPRYVEQVIGRQEWTPEQRLPGELNKLDLFNNREIGPIRALNIQSIAELESRLDEIAQCRGVGPVTIERIRLEIDFYKKEQGK
jgi:hypothetical protein